MKKVFLFILLILISSSCIKNGEGVEISIKKTESGVGPSGGNSSGGNSSGGDSAGGNSSGGDSSGGDSSGGDSSGGDSSGGDSPGGNSSQVILIDFDNTTLDEYFNITNFNGASYNQTSTTLNGTSSFRCDGAAGFNKSSCIAKSINTYDLPLTIEMDFIAHGSYGTGTYCGFSIYEESDPSLTYHHQNQWNYRSSGNSLARISWNHSYEAKTGNSTIKYVTGFGLLNDVYQGNVANSGKIKLAIQVDGTYQFDLMNVSGDVVYTNSGTFTYSPSNFVIEIYQANFDGNDFEIDNVKITN